MTFGVFRFWSLDLGNAGDHITREGFLVRMVLHFYWNVFLDARTLASSFEDRATTLTPSGETVTTRYGMPDSGG